jgi:magnesium-transporting ATPase (P-type)
MFFAFINGYSGTPIFDDWYISNYNMIFTALPLIAKAIFEYDVFHKVDTPGVNKFLPKLYYVGQRSTIFHLKNYLVWVGTGTIHSVITFCIVYYTFNTGICHENGKNNDMWSFSVTLFTAIIIVRRAD